MREPFLFLPLRRAEQRVLYFQEITQNFHDIQDVLGYEYLNSRFVMWLTSNSEWSQSGYNNIFALWLLTFEGAWIGQYTSLYMKWFILIWNTFYFAGSHIQKTCDSINASRVWQAKNEQLVIHLEKCELLALELKTTKPEPEHNLRWVEALLYSPRPIYYSYI